MRLGRPLVHEAEMWGLARNQAECGREARIQMPLLLLRLGTNEHKQMSHRLVPTGGSCMG